jgi:phage FluMu protein gp41
MGQAERHIERVDSPFAQRDGGKAVPAAASRTAGPDPAPPRATGAPQSTTRLGVRPARRVEGLRAMTGYEEELAEDVVRARNTASLCNEVLARCLVSHGEAFDAQMRLVEGLLVAERDVALVELRRLTFGEKVNMRVDCPACSEQNHLTFDLTSVALDAPEVAERLEVVLADGRKVELALPTARDQAELLDAGLDTPAERRTWLLERSIRKFGDLAGPLGFDRVHALDSGTRFALEHVIESNLPDLDLSIAAACHACGHEFTAPLDVAGFFLPS